MAAICDHDTHTVSVMAGTQIVKTEFLINVAAYYICQDPSPILFVQPTQGAAGNFSKERFAPTIDCTPVLRAVVEPPKSRDSDNTITHKSYIGGSLDFVGANSPTDLASRPKRIILSDEIDKYPPSAGSEGDPLKLAEERASTYRAVGRAKFVRTCSPTIEGGDPKVPVSRIAKEYLASDQRRLYVACPHCNWPQVLTWAHVRWDKDEQGNALADTAALACAECGAVWSERDRVSALDALQFAPGYGWRQTKEFTCCGETQTPSRWNDAGRSICTKCERTAPYGGHAGFHISKLYSKRHRLPEIVREFLEATGDPEALKKWTNSALAELWKQANTETFNSNVLMARAEVYGPDDLPQAVKVITAFCDVQGDRLEVQFVGWGADEECWPFQYTIINLDPAQPHAWKELDRARLGVFKVRNSDRLMRVSAFGIDMQGNHTAQVLSYCKSRRGQRVFPCRGRGGMGLPIWPGRATQTKSKDIFYSIGVDTAKDQIYSRLNIDPPEPGFRKPGYIHFPVAENFGLEYYEQLNSERRERRIRMGRAYTVWVQVRERNEVLDTFVGALAMRKSLPRYIEAGLEFQNEPVPPLPPIEPQSVIAEQPLRHEAFAEAIRAEPIVSSAPNWARNGRGGRKGWMDRS